MNELKSAKICQDIVDRSIDGIVVLDSVNKIKSVNAAIEGLSGYSTEELKNKSLDFLFPHEVGDERNKNFSIDNYLVTDDTQYFSGILKELELISVAGNSISVEMRAFEISPTEDGTKQYVAVIRDNRERKRLEDQKTILINSLKRLAYIDELTQLPNRRSFSDTLQKSIATVKRRNREYILAMVDIDRFKVINDTYGHDIGDTVLKSISTIFVDSLREEDTIGRIGGEEFACILPDTDLDGAAIVLDRMRVAVKSHRFFIFDNFYLNVTISIGYCRVHPTNKPDEIMKFADIALYQAKNSGRDMVQAYPF